MLLKTELEYSNLSKKVKQNYYRWNKELLENSNKSSNKIRLKDIKKYLDQRTTSENIHRDIRSGIKWFYSRINGEEFARKILKIKYKEKDLKSIEKFSSKKVNELNSDDIQNYIMYLKAEGESEARIRHIVCAITSEQSINLELNELIKKEG